jgi:hypothetical protein
VCTRAFARIECASIRALHVQSRTRATRRVECAIMRVAESGTDVHSARRRWRVRDDAPSSRFPPQPAVQKTLAVAAPRAVRVLLDGHGSTGILQRRLRKPPHCCSYRPREARHPRRSVPCDGTRAPGAQLRRSSPYRRWAVPCAASRGRSCSPTSRPCRRSACAASGMRFTSACGACWSPVAERSGARR